MSNDRSAIFEWAAEGRIPPSRVSDALRLAGVMPDAAQWRRFIDRLLLGLGVVLVAAGAVYFVAFNWQSLGRFAKFALAEIPIVVAIGVCWRWGLESTVGKAALVAAALFTGALLALVGQVYQTGADTFELFAAWALAIAVWVAVSRLPALWLLWLAITNVALALWFNTFGGVFGFLFGPHGTLWLLFAFDTAALLVWEVLAASGIEWLRERWTARVVATASGAAVTALAVSAVLDSGLADLWPIAAYLAWLGGIYYAYRRRSRDLFILAGAVMSTIVVITVTLADRYLTGANAGSYLVIGLVVIAAGSTGAWWLRRVSAEEQI